MADVRFINGYRVYPDPFPDESVLLGHRERCLFVKTGKQERCTCKYLAALNKKI